ncbi:2-keto-4-pentenoate hydratase [Bradyrhizobium canariense]|uniref:2-oxo-3-hexenedioate decarboxylase/2-keto-4-pentenoate hydratase n=1 Tax=Bradyrhizobium canariense TaxID=255045 RepID=A0A1H1VFZ4_9BRAD|nr:hypothetical protein [Bradyrhizobium canariense]SDS83724.1 2-oxo-3-hexenedioate decarboxylase/2-keto-4-pentenoate hydratase [Bradyrhizobium canariense]
MNEKAAGRAADMLIAAHLAKRQFTTFAPQWGIQTISDAYNVRDQLVARLRRDHGDVAGYKVGLTSAPMQEFCGIDHPITGVFLSRRVHRSGVSVRLLDYGRLGLEFEIAMRIGANIPDTGVPHSATTIRPYIESICAGIELVDDRAAEYTTLDVLSLLADNSWNGGVVLSDFTDTWSDLPSVPGMVRKDSTIIGTGHGRDVLGNPFESIAWLANHLASRNQCLKARQIVMTGSLIKTIFPMDRATYLFDLNGIGSVHMSVS